MTEHIDNFDQFREYIRERLTNSGDFFQILFMIRKKDGHPNTKITEYKYIYSVNDFDKNIDYIKQKCITKNARCYIKVNKRNDEIVSANLTRYVVDKCLNKEYHLLPYAYTHIVAVSPVKKNKLFIVDIDDITQLGSVLEELQKLKDLNRMSSGNTIIIKTRNGLHLLVPPFHVTAFKKKFKKIDVHKDAESLLFY